MKPLTFDEGTSIAVVDILTRALTEERRLVIEYGDAKTGQSWGWEHVAEGYVIAERGLPAIKYNARVAEATVIRSAQIVQILTSDGGTIYKGSGYTPSHHWPGAAIKREGGTWAVFAKPAVPRRGQPTDNEGRASVAKFATKGQCLRFLSKRRRFEKKEI